MKKMSYLELALWILLGLIIVIIIMALVVLFGGNEISYVKVLITNLFLLVAGFLVARKISALRSNIEE